MEGAAAAGAAAEGAAILKHFMVSVQLALSAEACSVNFFSRHFFALEWGRLSSVKRVFCRLSLQ